MNVNTIGNHEFDYGVDRLYNINDEMKTKYICSNFYKTGE